MNKSLLFFTSLFLMACIVGPAKFREHFWREWVPQDTIARLPNATRSEVRELLGEPDSQKENQQYAGCWRYRRLGRLAEFRIKFRDDDRVEGWWYEQ